MHVLLADGFAVQRDVGAEAARGQAPARHVDDDAADLDARHALGRVNGQARGVLRRQEVDDLAALDAVRALMADAEHLASMGAPAQRLRRLHRRQAGDQANDLRGADVEHRQNGAFARRDLAHARRERPEAHGWAPFFGRVALRPRVGRLLRQAQERPARDPQVDGENVALQDARLAFEAQKRGDRGLRIGFRQLDVDARFQSEIPSALADQNASLDAGLQFVHRLQERDEFAHPLIRAFSHDEGQIGIAAVAHLVDRRAVGGDRAHVPVLLPDAVRACARRCRSRSGSGRACARSPA